MIHEDCSWLLAISISIRSAFFSILEPCTTPTPHFREAPNPLLKAYAWDMGSRYSSPIAWASAWQFLVPPRVTHNPVRSFKSRFQELLPNLRAGMRNWVPVPLTALKPHPGNLWVWDLLFRSPDIPAPVSGPQPWGQGLCSLLTVAIQFVHSEVHSAAS